MTRVRGADSEKVAVALLEAAPLLMGTLRRELRVGAVEGPSLPQFHALLYLRNHPGAGLSEVADYVGATLPTMSELVNRLVAGGLVERETNPAERRRVCLTVTLAGDAMVEATMAEVRQNLARRFDGYPARQTDRLLAALDTLRDILSKAAREG